MSSSSGKPVEIETLELTHLAFFVGSAANSWVTEQMHRAGFAAVRQAHGYLIQHLVEGPRTVGELSTLLSVTQQAVSKSVAELETAGIIETVASDDARLRRVGLSALGRQMLQTSRTLRRKLERRLTQRCGADAMSAARQLLAHALEELGGAEAVRTRRVRAPAR
jgi:DNA-binding MarR family transcriptional regulator